MRESKQYNECCKQKNGNTEFWKIFQKIKIPYFFKNNLKKTKIATKSTQTN